MITLRRCAKLAGLNLDELVVGVAPAARHQALLQSYRLNMHRGPVAVRRMIVSDLLGYLDIGAHRLAADLFVVLRLFLSEENHMTHASRRQASGLRALGLDHALARPRHAPPLVRRQRAAPLNGAAH